MVFTYPRLRPRSSPAGTPRKLPKNPGWRTGITPSGGLLRFRWRWCGGRSTTATRCASAAPVAGALRWSASGSTSARRARSSASCAARSTPIRRSIPNRARPRVRPHHAADGPPGPSCCLTGTRRTYNPRLVDPFTVTATISKPREEVFEYLADIANHPEFTDHYLVDWHLTREDSYGEGAGARFRIKQPLNRFSWADMSFAEVQPPFRIVERGRGGKYNRIRMLGSYTLSPGPAGSTRVEYTLETVPALLSDRLMETHGRWRVDAAADPRRRCAGCGRSSRRVAAGGGARRWPRAEVRRTACSLDFRPRERPPSVDLRLRRGGSGRACGLRPGESAAERPQQRRVRGRRADHVPAPDLARAEPVRDRGQSVLRRAAARNRRARARPAVVRRVPVGQEPVERAAAHGEELQHRRLEPITTTTRSC